MRIGGISLLGSSAITGFEYATDGLLICPGSKLFVARNSDRRRTGGRETDEGKTETWAKGKRGSLSQDGGRR